MTRNLKLVVSNAAPKPKFEPTQLMAYLVAEASARNETPTQLARHLGINYVYLTLLIKGKKDTAKLGRETLVAAARYLDIPITTCYLYAGALKPTDFIHEWKFKRLSGDVYDIMDRHPEWGGFMPDKQEWGAMSQRARLAYILMYEEVTGESLIDAGEDRPH